MDDQSCIVGVDLGGTRIKAGRLDRTGKILDRHEAPSRVGYEQLIDRLCEAVQAVDPAGGAEAVGLGSPGPLDPESGIVLDAPNVPGLAGRPLAKDLQSACARPVFLENDANVAALGEWWIGGGRDAKSLVVITLGTGVGGGIVLDGRLLVGSCHAAGEIGHMCMDPNGPECGCGSSGCLEAFVSGPAIAGRLIDALRGGASSCLAERFAADRFSLTTEDVAAGCAEGDPLCMKIMAEAGTRLGIACANLVHLIAPERILIGGGVSGAGEFLLGPARVEMNARAFPGPGRAVRLERATLGNDAGFVGAARHAWNALES